MSVTITITIGEKAEDNSLAVARNLKEEGATPRERKMAVWYLLGIGRGLAHFGIEGNDPALLGLAADAVGAARNMYKGDPKDGGKG